MNNARVNPGVVLFGLLFDLGRLRLEVGRTVDHFAGAGVAIQHSGSFAILDWNSCGAPCPVDSA
jgi:hypothetical protein